MILLLIGLFFAQKLSPAQYWDWEFLFYFVEIKINPEIAVVDKNCVEVLQFFYNLRLCQMRKIIKNNCLVNNSLAIAGFVVIIIGFFAAALADCNSFKTKFFCATANIQRRMAA